MHSIISPRHLPLPHLDRSSLPRTHTLSKRRRVFSSQPAITSTLYTIRSIACMDSPQSDQSSSRSRVYRPRGAKDATLAARIAETEQTITKKRRRKSSSKVNNHTRKKIKRNQSETSNLTAAGDDSKLLDDEEEELLHMTCETVRSTFKSASSAQHAQIIMEQTQDRVQKETDLKYNEDNEIDKEIIKSDRGSLIIKSKASSQENTCNNEGYSKDTSDQYLEVSGNNKTNNLFMTQVQDEIFYSQAFSDASSPSQSSDKRIQEIIERENNSCIIESKYSENQLTKPNRISNSETSGKHKRKERIDAQTETNEDEDIDVIQKKAQTNFHEMSSNGVPLSPQSNHQHLHHSNTLSSPDPIDFRISFSKQNGKNFNQTENQVRNTSK